MITIKKKKRLIGLILKYDTKDKSMRITKFQNLSLMETQGTGRQPSYTSWITDDKEYIWT